VFGGGCSAISCRPADIAGIPHLVAKVGHSCQELPTPLAKRRVPLAEQSTEDRQKLQPVIVRMPDDLRELVRERAETEERTQAQVIRRALRHYLTGCPAGA
jgi:ribbon-helix-helix CopG family protein